MTQGDLEQRQIAIYLAAIGLGLPVGLIAREYAEFLELAIFPALVGLLYVTFLQVPSSGLRRSLTNARFLAALLTANFLVVPPVVWSLSHFLPDSPALRLGVFMVLLTPCIDYVVVFTHLGRGNASLILAATPVLLLAQMLLLPAYLLLFLGADALALMKAGPFLQAFLWFILLPLGVAWLTEVWARDSVSGRRFSTVMGWLPVPLLAITLFLVVGAEISRVVDALGVIAKVVPIFIAFMIAMPFLARMIGRLFELDTGAGRALVFSASTRNSLVILPLAFAVPQGGALVPAVIVTQTLIELFGELAYIRLVPRLVRP